MKYKTQMELKQFYDTLTNAFNIERDIDGNVIAFDYKKYYKNARKYRVVHVSLYQATQKTQSTPMDNENFFELLFQCILDKTINYASIKRENDKIYKFSTLDGDTYQCEKPPHRVSCFDYISYKYDFLKITRQRFYGKDTMLRNGYFSGLQGCNRQNVSDLMSDKLANNYILYDIDINKAYPSCFGRLLPCGAFYDTLEELKQNNQSMTEYTKFYEIEIKNIASDFEVFLPPKPKKRNYSGFDFLLNHYAQINTFTKQPHNQYMIVSQVRLNLINMIYGKDAYKILHTYYIGLTHYNAVYDKILMLDNTIRERKKQGLDTTQHKTALNSFVGMLGKHDDIKEIKNISLLELGGGMDGDFIMQFNYGEEIKEKQVNNYLPISVYINDLTAMRLFLLLNRPNYKPLVWNTDGGVVAIPMTSKRPKSTDKIGQIKVKQLSDNIKLYDAIYTNRPVIFDVENNYFCNTNQFFCKDGHFYQKNHITQNRRSGFIDADIINEIGEPPTWDYKYNFQLELRLSILGTSKIYRQLQKVSKRDAVKMEFFKELATQRDKILFY